MRSFKIDKYPYDDETELYTKSSFSIDTGLTILVGCNGAGKSTLLNYIKSNLKDENIPYITWDNTSLEDSHDGAKQSAGIRQDYSMLANLMICSEGESINIRMTQFASKLGYFCLNQHKNDPEIWILIDALDSGFSIDNIVDIKNDLFKIIIESKPSFQNIYIVASANAYELARGEKCFDVHNLKYIEFKDYEDYRNFVLKSRKIRDGR